MKDRGRQGRKEGERESLMQGNKVMCDRGDAKSTILVKTYREKVRKRERERGKEGERGRGKLARETRPAVLSGCVRRIMRQKDVKQTAIMRRLMDTLQRKRHILYTHMRTHTHARLRR